MVLSDYVQLREGVLWRLDLRNKRWREVVSFIDKQGYKHVAVRGRIGSFLSEEMARAALVAAVCVMVESDQV